MWSIFSCAFWLSVCLLWRNVYSDLLPILWLGCLLCIELHELYVYFWAWFFSEVWSEVNRNTSCFISTTLCLLISLHLLTHFVITWGHQNDLSTIISMRIFEKEKKRTDDSKLHSNLTSPRKNSLHNSTWSNCFYFKIFA